MRVALASHPEDRSRRQLAFRLERPSDMESLPSLWFPWQKSNHSGDFLFHATSLPFVLTLPWCRGYADAAARDWCRAYLTEARRTFTREKLVRLDKPGYDWQALFTDRLRPCEYQFAGMERIWARLKSYTRGVQLADDVGLGKTIQALGVVARMAACGDVTADRPAVVITTSPVRAQWASEARAFVRPGLLEVSLADGSGDERRDALGPGRSLYVASYEMARLPQYAAEMAALARSVRVVVLDETSAIANPESKTAVAVDRFCAKARAVVALNATPIENGLGDLYAQFFVMDKHSVGMRDGFMSRYVVSDDHGRERRYTNIPEFRKRMGILTIRRTRPEAGVAFAAVRSQRRCVEMPPAQAVAYRKAAGEFCESSETGMVGLRQLGAVQRAAFAADLLDPRSPSAKLDDLADLMASDLAGERVVVFTRYKTVAKAAIERMAKLRPLALHGDIPQRTRDALVAEFNSPAGAGRPMIGTEAMSRGLNLQAAGVVVNLDLPWNPARLRQRVGRVNRLGQARKTISVINYVARFPNPKARTIDDYFVAVIDRKRDIFDRVFGKSDVDEIGREREIDLGAVRAFLRAGHNLSA